jgi:hypothetical protein
MPVKPKSNLFKAGHASRIGRIDTSVRAVWWNFNCSKLANNRDEVLDFKAASSLLKVASVWCHNDKPIFYWPDCETDPARKTG